MHGWHAENIECNVSVAGDTWVVKLRIPFEDLGKIPSRSDVWMMNILRTNPSEKRGFVQWVPTFDDALYPELFGFLYFREIDTDRREEVIAFYRYYSERKSFFLGEINNIHDIDTLAELGFKSWREWDNYLVNKKKEVALRWEGFLTGKDGIPESDKAISLKLADELVTKIEKWSTEDYPAEAFSLAVVENLADAYLITGNKTYAKAFEKALVAHKKIMKQKILSLNDMNDFNPVHNPNDPYFDYQIVVAEHMAYAYLTMKEVGFSDETHSIMMWTILRACRFAHFNIRKAYKYGNHQIYESAGLACVAALFPEFRESDIWAKQHLVLCLIISPENCIPMALIKKDVLIIVWHFLIQCML